MALGIAPDQALLADAATGRELARLTTLQPVTPTPMVFSPDGTKLLAATPQRTVLVWDLRRIRDHPAPMGLDWDALPYPSGPAASAAAGPGPPPRPVRVVGGVIEPQARRAGELDAMLRRLAANPTTPRPWSTAAGCSTSKRGGAKRSPTPSAGSSSGPTTPTPTGYSPRRTRNRATWPARSWP
jgi:hypothetical protein